jgi:drug/metabolite transporter (DMT)-like permease
MPDNATPAGINKNLLILHFTVFIWGFTSILGKLISINAVELVWYRVVIASVSLFLYFNISKVKFKVDRKTFIQLALTGGLVGGHWILFFAAIKLSTVSVALVCISSMTLFTAIFEPLINKTRISKLEIVSGIFIIIGIFLIFEFAFQYTKGIICGLLCAMLASLFSIINSRLVKKIEAPVITFYELLGAFFWISIYLLFTTGFGQWMILKPADIGYLLILGSVCTALAYVAGVSVMREFSAFKVALITNLEPVYGIILAFIFFNDMHELKPGFWVGAIIIFSTIFLFPLAQTRLSRRRA